MPISVHLATKTCVNSSHLIVECRRKSCWNNLHKRMGGN